MTSLARRAWWTVGAVLSWLLLLGLAIPSPSHAIPHTCAGKRATIVSNAKRIVGTRGNDVIVAGRRANVIVGRGGNDTICGGGGRDRIFGGRGNDRLYGGGGRDRLHGGRGNDRLHGGRGSDRLEGGPGDDRLRGGRGNFDVLHGGAGSDRLDGGPGRHDVASFRGAGGPVVVDLGAGRVDGAESDRLRRIEDAVGGTGDDLLIGSERSLNRLDGGPGDDTLRAAGPGDLAFGGPGSDVCDGFAATVSCGPGRSRAVPRVELYAGIDAVTSLVISGTDAADAVEVSRAGGAYTVSSVGGDAAVRLDEPASGACAQLAPGTVSCAGAVAAIQANLRGGDDSFAVGAGVPARVETIADGGPGSDTLVGGPGDDILFGGDDRAPDTLVGGPGADVLFGVNIFHPRRPSGAARMFGGPGDDLLVGGQPCDGDLFHGGRGVADSASFARVRNRGVHVVARIGGRVFDPDVRSCSSRRIHRSIERIEGSPGPDRLFGDSGDNVLMGRGGDDFLHGRGGRDRCFGGGGRDRLRSCEAGSRR